VTATSANLGGKSPHYSIDSLLHQLPKEKQELIDLIVDAGKLPRNKPSTVIDLSQKEMAILRKGDILFTSTHEFVSYSAQQTHKVGSYIASKYIKDSHGKPIVFVIKGELGAGKTVLTKGIATYFNIENIISPTFVVYYEYDTDIDGYKTFVHADLYNIEDPEEYTNLGFEEYLRDGVVMVFEWGEKLGSLFNTLQQRATVIFIDITTVTQDERKIIVQQ
jgi:tRNA threonylcarbamoyl adenosine modification protein YjeE